MTVKKAQSRVNVQNPSTKGLSLSGRLKDMRAHGQEVRASKSSAVAFLQRAGILNDAGKLTKPYRG